MDIYEGTVPSQSRGYIVADVPGDPAWSSRYFYTDKVGSYRFRLPEGTYTLTFLPEERLANKWVATEVEGGGSVSFSEVLKGAPVAPEQDGSSSGGSGAPGALPGGVSPILPTANSRPVRDFVRLRATTSAAWPTMAVWEEKGLINAIIRNPSTNTEDLLVGYGLMGSLNPQPLPFTVPPGSEFVSSQANFPILVRFTTASAYVEVYTMKEG